VWRFVVAASRGFELPEGPLGLLVTVSAQGTTTTISLAGELDLAEQPAMRKAINDALECTPECVVLDLSRLDFIDSAGIHAVIELHRRSEQQHTRLVIVPGAPQVQHSFELIGLTEILPFLFDHVSLKAVRSRRAYTGAAETDGCLPLTPARLATRSFRSRRP
jgi:anti-anti-sigma factor